MSDFEKYKHIDNITFTNRSFRFFWNIIYFFLFKYSPKLPFFNLWRKFLLIFFGAKIGKGSRISPKAIIWAPWNLSIGDYSAIDDHVYLYTMDKITIGSCVSISRGSFICTGTHEIYSLRKGLITKPIVIEDHAWIASECFVHPGSKIAKGCVIGAKSVIKKKTEEWSIYEGNPAKFIKKRIIKK